MQGVQCDYCRRFAQYAFSQPNFFGVSTQTIPNGWVIMTEEKSRHVMSGMLDVLSSSSVPEPQQPSVFCSQTCLRDWLVAKSLIDGPGAS